MPTGDVNEAYLLGLSESDRNEGDALSHGSNAAVVLETHSS